MPSTGFSGARRVRAGCSGSTEVPGGHCDRLEWSRFDANLGSFHSGVTIEPHCSVRIELTRASLQTSGDAPCRFEHLLNCRKPRSVVGGDSQS